MFEQKERVIPVILWKKTTEEQTRLKLWKYMKLLKREISQ
jgi:hypothetical protein